MELLIKGIKQLAKENTNFRNVLLTGNHIQIVIMSLQSGEDIGEETHLDTDQVLWCVEGKGKAVLDSEEFDFEKGDLCLVKEGTLHDFINTGDEDMKIVTLYAPPNHPQGLVQKTKEK